MIHKKIISKFIVFLISSTLLFCLNCSDDSGGSMPFFPFFNGSDEVEDPGGTTGPEEPPPNPADVAPTLSGSVATTMGAATEFLYTGDNPVQRGVAPGTIDKTRVGVIRGKVLTKDSEDLPGVKITVLNRPEFGYTYSREDGMFDMAANGGGYLKFNYEKDGYITTQRQVNVPWQDFVQLPDVIMIQYDSAVKTIDYYDSMTVARSSIVTDARGERRATLIFPEGTLATLVYPDKSTRSIPSINVRATEYTVGEEGVESMPAILPPTSGYTYCVEFSADESRTGKAVKVEFSEPVYSYVEPVIDAPVGSAVPNGYFDRESGQWVASENGLVVKIVDITAGMADIDADGDDDFDGLDLIVLDDLGHPLTDPEREQLAALYSPGQVLWRVPITHFTPYDHNWPYGPPDGAEPPNQPDPDTSDPECDPCEGAGSILEYQNQVLGKRVPIVGTPFSLNYRSSRVRGNKASFNLSLTLSKDAASRTTQPAFVNLDINVGGQHFHEEITYDTILANIEAYAGRKYPWDGNDAYGRTMQGAQPVSIGIGYAYEAQYYEVQSEFEQSFASARGGTQIIPPINPDSNPLIALMQNWRGTLGTWDMLAHKIGGWSIDVHHAYSPNAKILYLGDGRRRTTESMPLIITTVAGGGSGGDGGPAIDAELNYPLDAVIASDGSLYIADTHNHRLRHVDPEGNITTIAGTGVPGYNNDNIPATSALLNYPAGVALGPDGSIYIADTGNNRIRRIGTDGIITTIAGNGIAGYNGDNIPATNAQLQLKLIIMPLVIYPTGIAVAPDGSIYIADTNNQRIRRIGTDGYITTVAGSGASGLGDNGPATEAELISPQGIAVSQNGSIYIADTGDSRIRRVDSNGIITTVAGTGNSGTSGDGGSAISAELSFPLDVEITPDGIIYIADYIDSGGCGRIRRIGNDNMISTIAGGIDITQIIDTLTLENPIADGISATRAFVYPQCVTTGPDGAIYILSLINYTVRRIAPPFSGYTASDILIPSEDGSMVYHFDQNGQHLETLNAITKNIIYKFNFNEEGLLTSIDDMNDLSTTIERDGDGNATAIVGPYGQRTVLDYDNYDGNDYLAGITNPNNEAYEFTYKDGSGLLTSITDPINNVSNYDYDANGLLTIAEDPAGGSKTFTRDTETVEKGYEVSVITKVTADPDDDRTKKYKVEEESTGDKVLTNDTGCCENIVTTKPDGTQIVDYSDGTIITQQEGPDPRWGMLAPVTKNFSIDLPEGDLSYNVSISHEVSPLVISDLFDFNTITTTMSLYYPNPEYDPDTNPFVPINIIFEQYETIYNKITKTLTSSTMEGRITSVNYDSNDRITQIQYGNLDPYVFSYDVNGRVESITQGTIDTRTTTFVYNPEGYFQSITR